MTILSHSGRYSFTRCPVLGCPRGRTTRCAITMPTGQHAVVTACEKHVHLLVRQAVVRAIWVREGDEGVARHVDSDSAVGRTPRDLSGNV